MKLHGLEPLVNICVHKAACISLKSEQPYVNAQF